ncbi:MAG TPA: helix-turn-helix domain-containing protein [Solirubrobacterales bacterium]|nr:helix-turn-helix domain-containing protein [Solirubrobacterales bacterium]
MATLQGKQLKQVINPTLAKAFTHPLRGHVWVTLCEKGLASPKEIADELGLEVSEVSYHFRELKRRGLIKLLRTVRRRGFTEHFYQPCTPVLYFDDFDWMQIPAPIRSTFSGDMLQQVIEELIEALGAGSFDARNRHLSRTWLLVDERGWNELMQIAQEALDRVQAIQKRCAKRRRKASEPAIPVSVVMASFETAASLSQREAGGAGEGS